MEVYEIIIAYLYNPSRANDPQKYLDNINSILDKWELTISGDKRLLSESMNILLREMNLLYERNIYYGDIRKMVLEKENILIKRIITYAIRDDILNTDCFIEINNRRQILIEFIKTGKNIHHMVTNLIDNSYYNLSYEIILSKYVDKLLPNYAIETYDSNSKLDLWKYFMINNWMIRDCECINHVVIDNIDQVINYIHINDIKIVHNDKLYTLIEYSSIYCGYRRHKTINKICSELPNITAKEIQDTILPKFDYLLKNNYYDTHIKDLDDVAMIYKTICVIRSTYVLGLGISRESTKEFVSSLMSIHRGFMNTVF